MEFFTSRYMTRFRCLGAACEDTCCQEWRIFIDKEHLDRLRERMASPEEQAEFAAGFEPVDEGRSVHRYALAVLRDDATCSFLAGGLCSLHARYGEDLIPDTCASYPRTLGRAGDRVELVATPGCPEIARLVLLDENANERVPGELALLGRGWANREIAAGTRDPYEANFLPIRGLVLRLLRARKFPIASRLYFVASFADRTRTSLRRGGGRFDARGLQQLGRSLQLEKNLDALHSQLARAQVDPVHGFGVVRDLLRLPGTAVTPAVTRLVDELAALLAAHGATIDGPAEELRRVYGALPPLPVEHEARLETLIERFASHHLLRNWYVERASFAGYFHELLLRVAAVRFLVGGLARLRAVGTLDELDALVVQVVYRVSRMLDGDSALQDKIIAALDQAGARLEHAVAMIRI